MFHLLSYFSINDEESLPGAPVAQDVGAHFQALEAQLAQAAQLWGAAGTDGTTWPAFRVAEVEDRYLEIHGRWQG